MNTKVFHRFWYLLKEQFHMYITFGGVQYHIFIDALYN